MRAKGHRGSYRGGRRFGKRYRYFRDEGTFQIASLALRHEAQARFHILDAIANDSRDTEEGLRCFLKRAVKRLFFGGDRTNRAIVKSSSDIDLIPLSTGTNNVFPISSEATLAGIVAGLNALGRLTE